MDKDEEKQSIRSDRHLPERDAKTGNRTADRAVKEPSLIDYAVGHLSELKFPAYKENIVAYAKSIGAEEHVVTLLGSLDAYIQYRDIYHLKKALEVNLPQSQKFEMTEETRTNPDFSVRLTTADGRIRDHEAVNAKEERKDYPEVTPTAAKVFSCDRCGKEFQSPDDLFKHQKFESGSARTESKPSPLP